MLEKPNLRVLQSRVINMNASINDLQLHETTLDNSKNNYFRRRPKSNEE